MRIFQQYSQRRQALNELADIYLNEKYLAQVRAAEQYRAQLAPPAAPLQPVIPTVPQSTVTEQYPPVSTEDPLAASVSQLVNDLEAEERAAAVNPTDRRAAIDAIKRRAY